MSTGIEFLFVDDWEGWDQLDTSDFVFYNVTLKSQMIEMLTEEQRALYVCADAVDLMVFWSTSQIEIRVVTDDVDTTLGRWSISDVRLTAA